VNFAKSAVLSVAVLLAGALANNAAEARPGGGHGHFHAGGGRAFFYAAPVFAGTYVASRYYYPPSYYYPPPVYYPPAPPVYIQQPYWSQSQAYWYYCAGARAYYPHVRSCPGGWRRVAPQHPRG
jgi:hypothetical protein